MNKKTFYEKIQDNPLPWLVQGVTILALIVSLYITSRIAPIAQDLALVKQTQASFKDNFVSKDTYVAAFTELTTQISFIKDGQKEFASHFGIVLKDK